MRRVVYNFSVAVSFWPIPPAGPGPSPASAPVPALSFEVSFSVRRAFHLCSFNHRGRVEAVSGTAFGALSAGMKMGKLPEGEAWFVLLTVMKGMSAMWRAVCHFRLVGFGEGAPADEMLEGSLKM